MKRIAILGSTGSIGRSTLSVAESYPDRFQIVALAAGSNLDAAFEQARRWPPRVISMAAAADADNLHTPMSKFASVNIEQALNHPTWKMGRKITIDSATLMNKGFEVIEACRLFHMPPGKVEVIVHPQSTIHSMVEFVDGSILAQFSVTDMRLPILYALTYPERIPSEMRFAVSDLRHLDFCPPDLTKFPCLRLAYEAAEAGGAKTVALNAADEVAVAAFLVGSIGFHDIPRIFVVVLDTTSSASLESIGKVLEADAEARRYAQQQVAVRKRIKGPRATSFA